MAVLYYTADKLIRRIRSKGQLPHNNNTFKDEDFLEIADEELSLNIVPSIIRQHENYFLFTLPVQMSSGVSRYKIPSRAAGNKLKDLTYQDGNGNVVEMTLIPFENIADYNGTTYNVNGHPIYYILNDEIVLFPENINSNIGTLLFTFYLKPNHLVKLEKVGVINAIDKVNKTITLSNLPIAFSSTLLYDFITVESPHSTLAYDIPIVSINARTKMIQFDVAYEIPPRLAVGDHMCIQNESAIPQIPSDLHPMLVHKVMMSILGSVTDSEGLANATAEYDKIQLNVETLINNRVEGSAKKIVNRQSFLRKSNFRRFGR